jgi:hypothetical protein
VYRAVKKKAAYDFPKKNLPLDTRSKLRLFGHPAGRSATYRSHKPKPVFYQHRLEFLIARQISGI